MLWTLQKFDPDNINDEKQLERGEKYMKQEQIKRNCRKA